MTLQKIALVSLSDGIWDPRPLRLSTTLAKAGYQVTQYGYPTNESMPALSNWAYVAINTSKVKMSRFRLYLNQLIILFGKRDNACSEWLKRSIPNELSESLKESDATVFIAMDYTLLPLLTEISKEKSGVVCYEAREYYQGQNHSSLIWRIFMPRIVRGIEGKYINRCAIVTTVSQGISNLLYEKYQMKSPPEIIYGFPEEQITSNSNSIIPIQIVFHGNLTKDREIHRFIKYFDFHFANSELIIRGNGETSYIKTIEKNIQDRGLESKVHLERAVSKLDLLQTTSLHNFGLIPWRNNFPQKQFSMPNKFFEYLSAGLPVICTDDSEIAQIVKKNKLGIVFVYSNIEKLAKTLKSLDQAEYDDLKSNVETFRNNMGFIHQENKLLSLYSVLNQ
jgi:glycosyltransferase involved in cell wall biosynthesis